ncbi:DUF3108 domain-containing protein [Cognatilysobacter tabacisoli]|uniref:DUF3108 domain-containing protein n=1 Tax=Cognatilysobacter tabacisoli TaxID=2315424 RepID=UPI000E6B3E7B|nr:DUF3108 domain-containing protein [Lysobacter tabacisoli]
MTMTTKTRGLLAATALALAAPLAGAAAPAALKPFTADYQANYQGVEAKGRMTLVAAGPNRWRYTLDISNSLANLKQSTVFEDRDGQWRPLSGDDRSVVLVKKVNKSANYDWSRGVASWTGDVKPDRAGPVKLQAGDVDALLMNLALVRDVAAGKPLRYRMVDDGRVKPMTYSVAGKESVQVGGQSQQATKLVSTNGDRQMIIWVVDGMPVPARIQQREDGKATIDLRVQSVN